MSKFLDENGLLYLWGKIKTLAGGKVDKVEGKGLSTTSLPPRRASWRVWRTTPCPPLPLTFWAA